MESEPGTLLANVIELEETLGMISEMTVVLRAQRMAVLPDFGPPGCRHLGCAGTDIASHRNRADG